MDATLIIPIVLGWLAGLFVNYAADVLPFTRRFSQPICHQCQTAFSWIDYLTLRPCGSCGKKRSLRMWLVQILALVAFVYFWLSPPVRLGFPLGMIVLIYFGLITVIDLEHRLILHPTSIAGAILGVIVGTVVYSRSYDFPRNLVQSLLGGLIGFGIMFVLYLFGILFTRLRARKIRAAGQVPDEEEALGGGDMYLTGVLGLMLGPVIVWALVYGALLGGVVSFVLIVVLLIRRRYASDALMTFIPYGPYFIVSAFYLLFL